MRTLSAANGERRGVGFSGPLFRGDALAARGQECPRHIILLFFGGRVVLLPVHAVASTMLRNLSEDEFGGEAALGEVRSNSQLRLLGRNFGIQKYEHGGASSAQGCAENPTLSSEFFQRGKQRR